MTKTKVFIMGTAFNAGSDTTTMDCDICCDQFPVPPEYPIQSVFLSNGQRGKDGFPLGIVCPACINKGPKELSHTMIEAADHFEEQAKLFRQAAAEMRTMKEWTIKDGGPATHRETPDGKAA